MDTREQESFKNLLTRAEGLHAALTTALKKDTCCVECLSFDEKKEKCLRFNARPPARVIAKGCPEYEPDIPF